MDLSVNQTSSTLSFIEQRTKDREEEAEKISSAKRINDAADDAAGLQITNRLTAEINQNQQLSINAQDQINTNNTQSGGLSAINESLQRANVLSVQSGNSLNDSDAIQSEFDEITEQVNTLASEYLGQDNFLSGLDANDPTSSQALLEEAFTEINNSASYLGAESNALASQVSTYETSVVNVSASRSQIEDTDFAKVSAEQQETEVLIQSAITNKKDEESRKGLLVNQVV
jgi:flagellin